MIKAEVEFDGKWILFSGFRIFIHEFSYNPIEVYKSNEWIGDFKSIEKAIKYCMDN